MDTGLCKHCPNCNKRKHSSVAYFCELCGTELINEPKREFCLRLRIPNSKIDIEQEQKTTISVFPFLLRKKDETSVQAVLIHEHRLFLMVNCYSSNYFVTISCPPSTIQYDVSHRDC